jgi:predicted NBD/HSP70 family sugar kinase
VPDVLVVGGAVGLADPGVLQAISSSLAAHGPRGATPRVRAAALGDDAALVGAAAWVDAIGGPA